jgi:hypothetical protein
VRIAVKKFGLMVKRSLKTWQSKKGYIILFAGFASSWTGRKFSFWVMFSSAMKLGST